MTIGLVSIFIPTRNRRPLLQRAVASVLAQTHGDFELLVVDDGSTDDTPAWLESLSSQDPRVRVLRHEESAGAPRSRNEAILQARGEWVTGLDDDDEFTPERLSSFVQVAALYARLGIPFSALYAQEVVLDGAGNVNRVSRKPARVDFEDLFLQNVIGNQLFVRRQVLIDAGLYDEGMPAWHDLDLAMRVIRRHGPALLVDLPTYRYHDDERPDRISRHRKEKIVAAHERLAGKWPDVPRPLRQRMYLQVLGPHYGFRASLSDWVRYLRWGINLGSVRRLMRRTLG